MEERKMFPDQVIREWIESTEDGITALQNWRAHLEEWAHLGCEDTPGDFHAALKRLRDEGLEGWADGNPAGDGLDRLAEVLGVE